MRAVQVATGPNAGNRTPALYMSRGPHTTSLTQRWPTAFKLYVAAHCTCFFLYTTLGKGFAYLGFPPLFVGEVLLVSAILAAARSQNIYRLLTTPIGVSLILFTLWQSIRTIPYINPYGILAMRDAMAWIYSFFGVAIAAIVLRLPNSIEYGIHRFKSFGKWYPTCGVLSFIMGIYFSTYIPRLPGSGIPLSQVRSGELCVQLAGITAFLMTGEFKVSGWWTASVAVGILVAGSQSRGGLLAFLLSVCAVALLRRQFARLGALFLSATVIGLVVFVVTAGTDYQIGGSRQFSPVQIIENLASVGGDESSNQGLQDSKTWRLNWWTKILDYTVYGEYFWTGKGYGINLAVDDGIIGFSSNDTAPLRSPHNSHLMFLARSGVPGASLWFLVQFSWLLTMLFRYTEAVQLRNKRSAALFSWLIAYWIAFLVNASFDVALEGPMSAIPFWTVFGLGWGAAVLSHPSPRGGKKLHSQHNQPQVARSYHVGGLRSGYRHFTFNVRKGME